MTKPKIGRPLKPLDWKKVDLLCSYKLSLEDVAYLSEISDTQLEARIRKEFGCSFLEYRVKKVSTIKVRLINKAIEKALAGDNTMLIFCLKNLCKWCDNPNLGYLPTDDR